jgi:hypothetical protein
VTHVVAGDHGNAGRLGELDGATGCDLPRAGRVAGDVDPEAACVEQRPGAVEERRVEAGVATGQGDEVGGVLLELLPGEEGAALLAAGVAGGQQAREVAVAPGRLDEEPQAIARLLGDGPVGPGGAPGDPHLGPDDAPQPRRGRRLVEAGNAVDAIAVGQGEGRVAQLGGARDEILGIRGRLQEREGAPAAQLDVILRTRAGGRHGRLFSSCFRLPST